ncbi:PAS/PAC sensor hybrid histidine kinase [Caballeronia temeraria]|uniref:histidine kinase n=2 Tax=Caballeronia temeraria TaxID=1777137 RepID=A0A158DRZ5_9BURK|nr:PAS/PAC sensor hybrid histidine kinase [Caballeronia temeraria]
MLDPQVSHVVRLVDDLLEVSRITSGKIELRRESLDLSNILTNAIETSRPVIDGGQHQLTANFPSEKLTIFGDPVRLTQSFANLLNNAAKYTNRGDHIELTATREETHAVDTVHDNGIGISPEMLPSIFEMFRQVEDVRHRAQGGLGIGLTLVQSLIRMHGGSVAAFSDGAGRGSEFTVRLPLSNANADPGTTATDDAPSRHPLLAGRKILVVDDNVDAAESLAILLAMMGAETRTAQDGPEALQGLETLQADAILMDISMPTMNGYELARHIRAANTFFPTIIAITGWGQEDDLRRSREAEIDAHLVKPVDIDLLLKALERRGT